MLRGVIAGSAWGLFIGVIVMALASQLASWRDLSPALEDALLDTDAVIAGEPEPGLGETPVVVAGSEQAVDAGDVVPEVPGISSELAADTAPDSSPPLMPGAGEAPNAPQPATTAQEAPEVALITPAEPARTGVVAAVTAPAPETAPNLDDTPPVAPTPLAPGQDEAPAELAEPVAEDSAPTARVGEDAPVELAQAAPAEPGVVAGGAADTSPSAPEMADAPAAPAPEPLPAENAPETPEAPAREAVLAEASDESLQAADAPTAPEQPQQDRPVEADGSGSSEVAQERAEDRLPQIVADAVEAVSPETPAAPEPSAVVTEPDTPASQTQPSGASALPGAPALRLPRIGDAVEQGGPSEPVDAVTQGAATSALEQYRIAFDQPAGTAPMSVILVLGPGATLTPENLGSRDIPFTVAVPAGRADAGELVDGFRAAGAEVVLIPDLPPRPRAQDVEVSLAVALSTLPGAVGLMDLGRDGFQSDRQATAAVLAAVDASGHGVITYAQGFNSAQRAAQQAGIPAGLVERELGEGPGVARGLEQAAFRARQQGGAIAVATATPEMVAILSDWATEATENGVALAPVSAVLTAD